ncbi:ABC transporter ATP-binding protein [Comamonas testosteroni]
MIDVNGVSIGFETPQGFKTVVHGVSLQVPQGQAYGLVGESGSGKSTVLRALCGMTPLCGGQMQVAGQPVAKHMPKAQRRAVQMVFQDPYASLHPRLTVDQSLREPLLIHGLDRVAERVTQALADVGLDASFRYRYPHQLSGGQRQRVAIARALVLEPQVLLLDEPTSALDVSVQAEVLNLLKKLHHERGLTMLLVSHNLAVVAFLCSQLSVMQHGRIVESLGTDAVRAGAVQTDYARQLLTAADGYRRVQEVA